MHTVEDGVDVAGDWGFAVVVELLAVVVVVSVVECGWVVLIVGV